MQREGTGSPKGLTKGVEATQATPGETEALSSGKGRTVMASLTWQMAFPVKKSPEHSISSCTGYVLPLPSLCSYNILQNLFSIRFTLPSWRWKGGSRCSARVKRSMKGAVAQLRRPGYSEPHSILLLTTAPCTRAFLSTVELSTWLKFSTIPNQFLPCFSNIFKLLLFFTSLITLDYTSSIPQRKKVNPRDTCHSLGLSNHSPTHPHFS